MDTSDELARLEISVIEKFIQILTDPCIIANRAGEIQLMNRPAESLTAYAVAELRGELVERLIPERMQDIHRKHRVAWVNNPSPRSMANRTLLVQDRNGKEIAVRISISEYVTRAAGPFVVLIFVRESEPNGTPKTSSDA